MGEGRDLADTAIKGIVAFCIATAIAIVLVLSFAGDSCDKACQNERSCQEACEMHGLDFECADYSYGSFGPTIKECWCWDEENNNTVQLW